ncbi:MAG: hypothetical protein HUU29_13810 [Planctomycetaceae bacterium]|nr:hypothetical protein [Planctomycetaceae bacterium]
MAFDSSEIASKIRADYKDSLPWPCPDNLPRKLPLDPGCLIRAKGKRPKFDDGRVEFTSEHRYPIAGRKSIGLLRISLQWDTKIYLPPLVQPEHFGLIVGPERAPDISLSLKDLHFWLPRDERARTTHNAYLDKDNIPAPTSKDLGVPLKAVCSAAHLLRTTTGIDIWFENETFTLLGTLVRAKVQVLDRGEPGSNKQDELVAKMMEYVAGNEPKLA